MWKMYENGKFAYCKDCDNRLQRIYDRYQKKDDSDRYGNFEPIGWICKKCDKIIMDNQDVYILIGEE